MEVCTFPSDSSNEEQQDYISMLPEECLSKVMKLTSPEDVYRLAAVCTTFQWVADLDDVWEHFLPSDLSLLLSRTDMRDRLLLLKRKELYLHLSHNWISLDGGLKNISLDFSSGAKKMFLPIEHLSLVERTQNPRLYIAGTIDYKDLSPVANYAAYLIFTTGAPLGIHHGMQTNEQNVLDYSKKMQRWIDIAFNPHSSFLLYKECMNGAREESVMREDGRWEINLGDFKSSFGTDEELSFMFLVRNSKLWRNEIIIEGVEVRSRR